MFTATGTTPTTWTHGSTLIITSLPVTIAWNEQFNAWSTEYSYSPENMCSNGIDIVTFKTGKIWKHNVNPIQGNFYGVQYQPELWVIFNPEPSNVKVIEAIEEQTSSAWELYDITTPGGQKSFLTIPNFVVKEGLQYAALWFDTLTPNVANPLVNGNKLRDTTMLLKFRYTGINYNKLFDINLHYIISQLHNR